MRCTEKRPTTRQDAQRALPARLRSNSARHWSHGGCGAEPGCSSASPAAVQPHSHAPHGEPGDSTARPFPARRDRAAAGPLPPPQGIHTQSRSRRPEGPEAPGTQHLARPCSQHRLPVRSGSKTLVPAHGVDHLLLTRLLRVTSARCTLQEIPRENRIPSLQRRALSIPISKGFRAPSLLP